MTTFKNVALGFLVGAIVLGPAGSAFAQTSSSTRVEQIKAGFTEIKTDVEKLQNLLKSETATKGQIKDARKEVKMDVKLTRDLFVGLSGDDVKALQEFLATDPDIFPEGRITGYYGPLTEKAVKRFQKKHGIEQAGRVGPKTRAQLEIVLNGGSATINIPPGLMKKIDIKVTGNGSSTINIGTTTNKGPKHDDDDDDGFGKIRICHIPPGNAGNKHTISVSSRALLGHIIHGDKIGACDGTGTTTPPTPPPPPPVTDTTAPVISAIAASTTTATGTTILWTTNENADSKVWYGTTSPLQLGQSTMSANASLVTAHSLSLTGLTASTTYHFLLVSKDAAGNTATSSQTSFTTL